jgi:hypothetical protein
MSVPETPAEADPAEATRATGATDPASRPSATRAVGTPRHILVIIAGVFAVSLLKGLRMPNLWATTHMTFNYSGGFIRRALFGQILRLLGGDAIFRYNRLALVAVLLFVIAATVMVRLVRRMLATDGGDQGLQAVTLVFAASPGMVFLAHEIGYLDYVGLIAVPLFIVWAARARTLWAVFYVATAICVVLALIHESMIIMFAPTLLFTMVNHIVTQSRARQLGRRTVGLLIAHAAAAAGIALIASSVVGTAGTASAARIHALQASIARVANFPLRGDAFDVLYRPVRENFDRVMPWYWSFPANRRYLVSGLLVTLPGLAVMSLYAVRLIARLPWPRLTRTIIAGFFLAATFSPLLLNFVGWDAARWNAIAFFAAFSCVASLRLFFAPRRIDDPWMLTGAAAVIVLGLTSNYFNFLFDGYVVQWFPFDGPVLSLWDLVRGNFTFIPGM